MTESEDGMTWFGSWMGTAILFLVAGLFVSCREPGPSGDPAAGKVMPGSIVVDSSSGAEGDSGQVADEAEDLCVAGDPEAWFHPGDSGVVSSRFVLARPHEADETALLADGDSLRIESAPCEYWSATFSFRTRASVGTCPALGRFLHQRIEFLAKAKQGDPLANDDAVRALDSLFPGQCDTAFHEGIRITFGYGEMLSYFTMEDSMVREIRSSIHEGRPATVRFSMSFGPL